MNKMETTKMTAGLETLTPNKRNTYRAVSLVLVVLVLAGVAGGYKFQMYVMEQYALAMSAPGPTPDVHVMTAQRHDVDIELQYLGQTMASQVVEVRARAAGYLEKQLVEEGSPVQQGQLLFELEKDVIEAHLESAKAGLMQAQAKQEQAKKQVDRFTQLVARDAAPQKELDDWVTALRMAEADIQAAKAQIRKVELDLGYTKVYAPLTGRTGKVMRDVGSYLDPMNPSSDSLLVVVQQDDPIYVEFAVGEKDLLKWKELGGWSGQGDPGVVVKAILADASVYDQEGKLNFVDAFVDVGMGTAMVRGVFANAQGQLRSGQFVRVKLIGLKKRDVITIPQEAIIQTPMGAMVYVAKTVKDKTEVEARPVVLGDWAADRWIVQQGLEVGDQVILDRLTQIRPGTAVEIIKEENKTTPNQ